MEHGFFLNDISNFLFAKLGHGNEIGHSTPKRVDALVGLGVSQIACGSRHTAIITTSGAIYTWGDKENGKYNFSFSNWMIRPERNLPHHTFCYLHSYFWQVLRDTAMIPMVTNTLPSCSNDWPTNGECTLARWNQASSDMPLLTFFLFRFDFIELSSSQLVVFILDV